MKRNQYREEYPCRSISGKFFSLYSTRSSPVDDKKSSATDPYDVDHTCFFEKVRPGDSTEATAEIFCMGKLAGIEKFVNGAIGHARILD